MSYVEFTHPRRSPTAPQMARILKAAARRGVDRVEIARGEASVIFAHRERYIAHRVTRVWEIDYAPGGGHTIRNPRRACELANEVPA